VSTNRANDNHQSPLAINLLLVEDNEDDIVLIKDAFAEAKFLGLINGVSDGEAALVYLRGDPLTNRRYDPDSSCWISTCRK